MATTHVERERKFDRRAAATLPDLHGLPQVSAVEPAATEDLDAVYYDTEDRLLLAHRVTLRRRTGGHDQGWHLKLPNGPDSRREVRLPLTAGEPGAVPSELELRVRSRTRGGALAPVALLHTRRHRRLLLDAQRRPLAEIAEDAVTARIPQPSGEVLLRDWEEVEAELELGDTALLDALEERFRAAGLERSASGSKLARALAGPGGGGDGDGADGDGDGRAAGPGGAAPGAPVPGSIGELLTELVRAQVEDLLTLDGAVRRDRPEGVHDLRVAARRLRSTLRSHRRTLDRAAAEPLAAELRWLGHCLSEARDSQVIGELLLSRTAELPEPERPGPMPGRITVWSADRYRRYHGEVLTELDGARYFALLAGLERFAARPVPTGRGEGAARAELRRVLRRERRRFGGRLATARDLPPGADRDQALHAVRRAAKRARYAAEGAAPVCGKGAQRLARRMKAVQTLLGSRQDAVLARWALPRIAASAHAHGEPGFGYGVLYAVQAADLARYDADLPELWAAAAR
ncbi:CYTH and CHAD domain-containing protein [Streptacidiphilus sp. P02-A3a]|uniref:CYTH and CHAD domain-containing protein n=1 Tax=Streptacidiphilus sp. P02-A3a TaxID=2704468 RepID=UPI0015F8E935|nr:CYTH and CHAD domain-containing protein [Streptacidiphilus sp. P02-A3a]QMU70726.1 CYTH and CHAD domain-containing protein [Streptacidiphilus sp. P02-A3a]